MDALNTTMMVDRPEGPEQRRSKIVPAARWVSIDYRSIVANAVAGLADNTPDAGRNVYAQARGVVHRHLQLMRLPEPIVSPAGSSRRPWERTRPHGTGAGAHHGVLT